MLYRKHSRRWSHSCFFLITWALIFAGTPCALAQKISLKSAPGAPIPQRTPSSVVTGDFKRHGLTDFAVVSTDGNSVSVFLSNGDGTFQAAPNSPYQVNDGGFLGSGSIPIAITAGDFNGDGILDLAVTNLPKNPGCGLTAFFGSVCSSVAVLLGNPDGSFQSANNFDPGGHLPTSVATGDFDGDGKLDLVITNFNDGSVSILLGDGTGKNFKQATGSPFKVGTRPVFVAVEKFNGDGVLDLAVANADGHDVAIFL